MSKLLKKLKSMKMATSLKDQIASDGKKPKDTRWLNYFDLKNGERITILLMPFEEGSFVHSYKLHGPNLRKNRGADGYIRGMTNIQCAHTSTNTECPACKMGYNLLNLEKETGDEYYKVEAKKWFSKEYNITSCIVLDSSLSVQKSPDGNEVKLFNMPYSIYQMIHNSIAEGIIGDDEIFTTPLTIKCDNDGGFNSYKNSFFRRSSVTDDELAHFDKEETKVELFSIDTLVGDVFPVPANTEDVQKWVDEAEELYMAATGQGAEEEEARPAPTQRKPLPEARRTAPVVERPVERPSAPSQEFDEDFDEDWSSNKEEPQQESPQEAPVQKDGGSSVRDRLARLRR